ncbi:hypothetical protein BKA70DRAFT_1500010 [Coprinopsis sp. MPI-PUGE-AT-0042]|nr:hypothetical protein BKA70DRAFT_1500010 [Coprinopsis sp. MPI-PUGE-AT-0042]
MSTETTRGQTTAPFPFRSTGVTRLDISGGTWNNVEGNSITLHNCKVFVTRDGQLLQSSPLSSVGANGFMGEGVSPRTACNPGGRTKPSHTTSLRSASLPGSPPSVSSSVEFLIALDKLEDINQLIAPHTDAIGIFKRVEPHLRELGTLVGFASTAYTACGRGTVLGDTIRATIDTRMKQCNRALSRLLILIARLPHRSFPHFRYAYSVVHEWWTGNEPEEIRTIRLSVEEEVTAIGEWLRCLHSFWWASSQLLTTGSNFTMGNLHDFLESGPISMLRQIVVEEIIFLEPLQGEGRSIPIRFIETFEDIHLAIEMACHGTAASRFIDKRLYQLDESETDAVVSQSDILQRIAICRVFEITIMVFSMLEVSANVCPRCETSHDRDNRSNGWAKCHCCGAKFKTFPGPSAPSLTATTVTSDYEGMPTLFSVSDSSSEGEEDDFEMSEASSTEGIEEKTQEMNDQPSPVPPEKSEKNESDTGDAWDGDGKMVKLFRRVMQIEFKRGASGFFVE